MFWKVADWLHRFPFRKSVQHGERTQKLLGELGGLGGRVGLFSRLVSHVVKEVSPRSDRAFQSSSSSKDCSAYTSINDFILSDFLVLASLSGCLNRVRSNFQAKSSKLHLSLQASRRPEVSAG